MQVETTFDLRDNIAALYIAILREDVLLPEEAFAVISESKYKLTEEDVLDMIRLREQGEPYEEIAEIYGYTVSGIKNRVYKHRKKTRSGGNQKRSTNKNII